MTTTDARLHPLPAEEIARRRPVWSALSEFWLDTELHNEDHKRIAGVLRDSGYSLEALHDICVHEVSPVVSVNLLSVAGVWSGFDVEFLSASILNNLAHPSIYARVCRALHISRPGALWGAQRHWDTVEDLLRGKNEAA